MIERAYAYRERHGRFPFVDELPNEHKQVLYYKLKDRFQVQIGTGVDKESFLYDSAQKTWERFGVVDVDAFDLRVDDDVRTLQ